MRVLIVDAHPLFRRGLREHLEASGLDVVGEAEDAAGAVALSAETEPDVVLMDISMPGGSGIDATRKVRVAAPRARVLMMTVSAEEELIVDAIMAGACGCLLKDSEGDQILAAIAAAAAGESALSPRVRRLVRRLAVRTKHSVWIPPGKDMDRIRKIGRVSNSKRGWTSVLTKPDYSFIVPCCFSKKLILVQNRFFGQHLKLLDAPVFSMPLPEIEHF
jgi:DNA-binding NarL/FixJ family response regulator